MLNRSIVVFTRDLRTMDNPALYKAAQQGEVFPLFVFDEDILESNDLRSNRMTFLLESLEDLQDGLGDLGSTLFLRNGKWVEEVINFTKEKKASTIHIAKDYSSLSKKRQNNLSDKAKKIGASLEIHEGVAVVEPGILTPPSKEEYKIFSPYYRKWNQKEWREVLPKPKNLSPIERDKKSFETHKKFFSIEKHSRMNGGEKFGQKRMQSWITENLENYSDLHNDLASDRTSRLSPYLHFGCISPLEVAVLSNDAEDESFVRQVCWRDFFLQVLNSRPDSAKQDYRPRNFKWISNATQYKAWKEGRTGYPLVDAGMRQLLIEGFMHNRARMVTASFFTKDLHMDWRLGAKHFMDHLIDGDVASNQLNWQWAAGTGTDFNPHRIFNPIRQSERFDKNGDYIKRWIPELEACSAREIHDPDPSLRKEVGYPEPLVNHAETKDRYKKLYAS